jgi:hypothetical protein
MLSSVGDESLADNRKSVVSIENGVDAWQIRLHMGEIGAQRLSNPGSRTSQAVPGDRR